VIALFIMKTLDEKQIKEIERKYTEEVWGNSYNAARYAKDASDKQVWLLNTLLRENGYVMIAGSIRKGMAQALIWWLKGDMK